MEGLGEKQLINSLVVLILLVLVLSAAFYPLYPDEVAYRITLGRFLQNGGLKQTLMPFCEAAFLQPVPLVLYPAAVFWAAVAFSGHGFLAYRWLSLSLLSIILFIIIRREKKNQSSLLPAPLLKLSFGPIIYGLIIFRPEIIIIFSGIILYCIQAFFLRNLQKRNVFLLSIVSILIFDVAVYTHPKAIYLCPLAAFSVIWGARGFKKKLVQILWAISGLAVLAWISISLIKFDVYQCLHCPEVPSISEMLNSTQSVNPIDLLNSPTKFFRELSLVLDWKAFQKLSNRMTFNPPYDAAYLPNHSSNSVVRLLNFTFVFGFISTFISCFWGVFTRIIRGRGNERKNAISLALLFCAIGVPSVFNLNKAWYDVSFAVGGLYLVSCFLPETPIKGTGKNPIYRMRTYCYAFSVFIALASQALISFYFTRHFLPLPKVTLGSIYEGPNISWLTDFSATQKVVNSVMREANLTQDTPMIVDDLTYEFLKQRSRIAPATYLGLMPNGNQQNSDSINRMGFKQGLVRCELIRPLNNIFSSLKVLKRVSYLRLKSNPQELCLFII